MKMNSFYIFLLLAYPANVSAGRFEIFKEVDGVETPVSDKLEVIAGTNLTLSCKSGFWSSSVFWGWKRGNLQFKNTKDLQDMAQRNDQKLYQFRVFGNSVAKKLFHPLFPQDSGLYFCMDIYSWLIQIVELNVIVKMDPENWKNYLQAINNSLTKLEFNIKKTRINLPKLLCTIKMFMCTSGVSCVDYAYVCDGKFDCEDDSDENADLCGYNSCHDKQRCDSGRCCCDKDMDLNCIKDVKMSCCFEDDFEGTRDGSSFKKDWNDLTYSIASTYSGNMGDDSLSLGSVTVMFLTCIIIAILIVLAIIYRRRLLSAIRKIRTGNLPVTNLSSPAAAAPPIPPRTLSCTPSVTPDISAEVQLLSNQCHPPSYDEVVAGGTQPTAPIYEKCMA